MKINIEFKILKNETKHQDDLFELPSPPAWGDLIYYKNIMYKIKEVIWVLEFPYYCNCKAEMV